MVTAEALAETLHLRGERGLVGWASIAITICASVVGHTFDIRGKFPEIVTSAAPKAARNIYLIGYCRIKEWALAREHLIILMIE